MKTDRLYASLAGLYGLTAVALGAFGAHALKASVSAERLATWHTAVEYQMSHALVLLVVSLLIPATSGPILTWSARTFSLGVVLFSGSLYTLVLADMPALGMVTPLGGVLMLTGWLLLILHFIKQKAPG